MEPSDASAWLEALVGAVVPQVIIASHAELLEYPPLTLLDRVRWIQLAELHGPHYGVNVLDGKAMVGGPV